jgi:hypothetical protein
LVTGFVSAPLLRFGAVLLRPTATIADIAANPPSGRAAFFGGALWLGLLPPLFAYVGTSLFGWRLGVAPLRLSAAAAAGIGLAYFALLLTGFASTALVARWMAASYGADRSLSRCVSLVTLVGAPLTVGSVAHLYPNAVLNVIVLVPTLIWSMYLLYRGLPAVMKTDQARGFLMASALIAYLLVAWVSLLGVTAVLWSLGLGPRVAT